MAPPEGLQFPEESSAEGGRGDGLPAVPPDAFEQDHAELVDNVVPSHGYRTLPMVGLGGSAGSLRALQEFFPDAAGGKRDGFRGGGASVAGAR